MSALEQQPLKWKVKPLIIANLTAFILFASWLVEPTRSFWLYLDTQLFQFFNNSLVEGSDSYRYFWAALNMRIFDRVMALLLLGIFIVHALTHARHLQGRHIGIVVAMFIVLGVWTGYGTLDAVGQLIPIERPSATLEFSDSFRITQWATDMDTKDSSSDSFPGDHGMILMIVAGFAIYYFSGPYTWIAIVLAFFGTLPRVVVGAHWLTDEIVGAAFITILALSWNFHTPIGEYMVRVIDSISTPLINRLRSLLKSD